MGFTHTALFAAVTAALASVAAAPIHAAGAEGTARDGDGSGAPSQGGASSPGISLDAQWIRSTGATSLDELLQRLPSVYIGRSARFNAVPSGSNRNDGSATVGLRNLGSNRTLVLVNGRRQVGNGIDGGVDLNAIPIAAVQRIDVYSGGDSARHGEGAVAGVIDIHLVSGYSGAGMSAQWGEYTQGDGRRQKYDFLIGFEGDRGHATIGAGFVKEDPIGAGDRDISAVPTFGLPATDINYGGASGIGPRGRLLSSLGQLILIPGRPGTSPEDYRPFNNALDGYNFAPDNYLQTPQQRTSLFMDGRYQVLDGIGFYTQATFNERTSEQLLSAFPGSGGAFNSNPNFNVIRVSANNLYNPLGVELTGFGRRWVEQGGRSFNQDVDNYSFVGGFQGEFLLGDNRFGWDVGYQYAKAERSDQNYGFQNALNLRNALGPSFIDATGAPRCGTVTAPIPGCVPVNIFGDAGSVTPAMLDYIGFVEQGLRGSDLSNYWAKVTGDVFELVEGRPATVSGGYEYRRESAFDQPDAFTNAGLTSGNFRPPTRGGYSSDEFHLQLAIPLLADLPAVQLLAVDVAGRHSDYSTFGDTSNFSGGITWQPIEDLTLRGSWAEGFRAPTVGELFPDSYDTFPTLIDPCSSPHFENQPPPVQQRCLDDGAVPGYTQLSSQIRVGVAGNPFLSPELSRTRTLGIEYAPHWFEGFNVSLDWQRIAIDDAIVSRSGQYIVNACYLDPDPGVRDDTCRLFDRFPGGVLRNLTAGPVNSARLRSEHWDLALDYTRSTTLGEVGMDWLTTYSSESSLGQRSYGPWNAPYPDPWQRTDRTGQELGDDMYPRLRSLLRLAWQGGDFGVDWWVRYTHRAREECTRLFNIEQALGIANPCSDPLQPVPGDFRTGSNHVGSHTLHDLRLSWTAPWRAQLALGIDNVFDKQPPVSYTAFANSYNVAQFQPPGRSWFLQYRQQW